MRRFRLIDAHEPAGVPGGLFACRQACARPPVLLIAPAVRGHRFCLGVRNTATVPPAADFFLPCQKKVSKKEAQDAFRLLPHCHY